MTKHKKKLSKTKKEKNKFIVFVLGHKLIILLSVILLLALLVFPYNKYKDWDNAQQIKGIARDFPLLVTEIEKATGLDLEIKKNCSATQEKFGDGVKTCEVSVASLQDQKVVDTAVDIALRSNIPSSYEKFENNNGYRIYYRNVYSCQMSNSRSVYITCITGVREANEALASEVFSQIQN